MNVVLDFIIKYWLEFVLGIVATGLSIACKKIYKMYKSEKQHQKTKEQKEFYAGLEKLIKQGNEESKAADKILQDQIDVVTQGVLNIQKRHFKQECRELLKENHEITLEEYETANEDHDIYNALGGNHDGDTLFDMVRKKATNNITDK